MKLGTCGLSIKLLRHASTLIKPGPIRITIRVSGSSGSTVLTHLQHWYSCPHFVSRFIVFTDNDL